MINENKNWAVEINFHPVKLAIKIANVRMFQLCRPVSSDMSSVELKNKSSREICVVVVNAAHRPRFRAP